MKPKPGDSHSHSYAYFRASEGGKLKWEKLLTIKVLISYVHSWAETRKLYIPTFPN